MEISSIQSVVDLQKKLTTDNNQVATTDFSDALQKALEENNTEELKEGCKEIESYMLSYVFKKMKSSMLTGDTYIEKGDYEEMFEDNMIEAVCKEMVEAGGIGLADSMYKQMVNTYQAQNALKSEAKASSISQEA